MVSYFEQFIRKGIRRNHLAVSATQTSTAVPTVLPLEDQILYHGYAIIQDT